MIMPVGQMIIVRTAGKENLGRVMGVLSTPTVLAPVIGPTLGGILLQSFGWQWIFLINVPIGIVALIYGIRVLPSDEPEEAGKLDVVGLFLAAAGTVSLIYGLSDAARIGKPVDASARAAPSPSGLVLLAAFVWWSLRSPAPLLNLRLFRHRGYAAVTLASLMSGAAMFASMVISPLYFQIVRGEDATHTGLLVAPTSIGVALVISAAGRATDRYGGGRVAVIGLLVGLREPAAVHRLHRAHVVPADHRHQRHPRHRLRRHRPAAVRRRLLDARGGSDTRRQRPAQHRPAHRRLDRHGRRDGDPAAGADPPRRTPRAARPPRSSTRTGGSSSSASSRWCRRSGC